MKTKTKKIIAGLIGVALVLFLLSFVNAWVGNPLSKFMAKNSAEKYVAENYSDLNLKAERVNYNFKFSNYVVYCRSETSIDTAFAVYLDSFGRVLRDDYPHEVANNFTTYRRLDSELRKMGGEILRNNLKYKMSNALFSLDFLSDDDMEHLEKDMPLDVNNPSFKIGASVYVEDPDVSYTKTAEILKAMEKVCKDAGIPIATYSVSIEYDALISTQDGAEARERKHMSMYHIPAELLSAEDLPKELENLDILRNSVDLKK